MDFAQLGFSIDSSQLEKATRHLDKMGSSALGAEKSASGLGLGFASVAKAAGGAAAALAVYTAAVGDSVRETDAMAEMLRLTTSELQQWDAAARKVGLETGKIGDIFKDVQDKIGDFVATGGGEAADIFERMSFDAKKLAEQTPDAQLLAIADGLDKIGTRSEQIFFMESLANDAARLIPLLEDGASKLKEAQDQALRTGRALSSFDNTALVEYSKQVSELGENITGAGRLFAADLAPAFDLVTSKANNFLESLDMRDTMGGVASALGDFTAFALDAYTNLEAGVRQVGLGWTMLKSMALDALASQAQGAASLINQGLNPILGVLADIAHGWGAILYGLSQVTFGDVAKGFESASDAMSELSYKARTFKVDADDITQAADAAVLSIIDQQRAIDELLSRPLGQEMRKELEALKKDLEAQALATDKSRKSTEKLAGAQGVLTQEVKDQAKALLASIDPLEDLSQKTQEAWKLAQQGAVTYEQAAKAIEMYAQAHADSVRDIDAVANAIDDSEQAVRGYAAEILDAVEPHRELERELKKVELALKSGDISLAQAQERARQLREEFGKTAEGLGPLESAFEDFGKTVEDTFYKAFEGSLDSFDDFSDALLDGLKKLAYQVAMNEIKVGITGQGSSIFSSGQAGGAQGLDIVGMGTDFLKDKALGKAVEWGKDLLGFGSSASTAAPVSGIGTGSLSGTYGIAAPTSGAATTTTAATGFSASSIAAAAAPAFIAFVGSKVISGLIDKFSGDPDPFVIDMTSAIDAETLGNKLGLATGKSLNTALENGLLGRSDFGVFGAADAGSSMVADYLGGLEGYQQWLDGIAAIDNALASSMTPEQIQKVSLALQDLEAHGIQPLPIVATRVTTALEASGNQYLSVLAGLTQDEIAHKQATAKGIAAIAGTSADQVAALAIKTEALAGSLDVEGFTQAASTLVQLGSATKSYTEDARASLLSHADAALSSGASALEAAQSMLELTGVVDALTRAESSLYIGTEQVTASTLELAKAHIDAAGSLQALASIEAQYYDLMYTQAEKSARALGDVTDTFEQLGFELPKSQQGFRDLVESLDVTDTASAALKVELMSLAPAFMSAMDASKQLTSSLQSIYQQNLGREADAEGLAYWQSVLESGASEAEVIAAIKASAEGQAFAASQLAQSSGAVADSYEVATQASGAMIDALDSSGASLGDYGGAIADTGDAAQAAQEALAELERQLAGIGKMQDSIAQALDPEAYFELQVQAAYDAVGAMRATGLDVMLNTLMSTDKQALVEMAQSYGLTVEQMQAHTSVLIQAYKQQQDALAQAEKDRLSTIADAMRAVSDAISAEMQRIKDDAARRIAALESEAGLLDAQASAMLSLVEQQADKERAALQSAHDMRLSLLDDEIAATEGRQRDLQRLYDSLASALDDTKVLTDEARAAGRAASAAELERLAKLAATTGKLPTGTDLSGILGSVTSAQMSDFSSYQEYALAQGRAAQDIFTLGQVTDAALTVEEKTLSTLEQMHTSEVAAYEAQLAAIDEQVQSAQAIVERLTSTDKSVQGVDYSVQTLDESVLQLERLSEQVGRRTVGAIYDEIAAIETARDMQLSSLEQQLAKQQEIADKAQGIWDATLSVKSAISSLASAISAMQTQKTTAPSPIVDIQRNYAGGVLVSTGVKFDESPRDMPSAPDRALQSRTVTVQPKRYAMGGVHEGGWRVVGEQGPELEYTPPSRIFSASKTDAMLDTSELVQEMRELRLQNQKLMSLLLKDTGLIKQYSKEIRNIKLEEVL